MNGARKRTVIERTRSGKLHRNSIDVRRLTQSHEELRPIHQMCREGRLYDVERWIAEGKALQLAPEAVRKGTRPKTALQIALETGQHSLVSLLLRSGYRLDLERYAALDVALKTRRWDLFDLLVEWGADLKTADVYTVLETYNVELYERFWASGYDLTERHEMGAILGRGTSNRPPLGFLKRHRTEDTKLQNELNIALGYQARAGNERGVALCLWAGADPHAPARNLELGIADEADDGEEHFVGWSAIGEAARAGHLTILKRLEPDPARDDFDELYRLAKYEFIVVYLATIHRPKDLTSIVSSQLWSLDDRFSWAGRIGTGAVEAILKCGGAQWLESDSERLGRIRQSLLKVADYHLKTITSLLRRPEICAPETFQQLIRTPRIQQRLTGLGLMRKPLTEREKRKQELEKQQREISSLMRRYDRQALYEQVWAEPVQNVAKSYGVSGVRLGRVCRRLNVPVPPRGYSARVRHGHLAKKPTLPKFRPRRRLKEPERSSLKRT
jgi:hypothetical protein